MGPDARKRKLTSLLLAMGALALGLVAQDYFGRILRAPSPTDGLLVLALAVALFAVAFLRASSRAGLLAHPAGPHPADGACATQKRPGGQVLNTWRFGAVTLLLVIAGAATIVSLALFRAEVQPQLKWLFYLLSIVLIVLAAYVLEPTPRGVWSLLDLWRDPAVRRIAFAFLVILAIGAFFRLYRFAELPYGLWYDEADNGLWARQILAHPDFRPIYVPSTNLPAHFLYLIALAFRVLGDSMYAIRAVAVVFGLLTIVAAYYCGREFGGPIFGLGLAFLLAVSRWDVIWSRIGMHGVTVPFFELWVVAALLRGLRTRRLTAFGWAGVALGLGLCFYSPFRVFPLIVAGFLLAWGVKWLIWAGRRDPRWAVGRLARHTLSTWGLPVLLFTLGVLVAVAPVAQYSLDHPDVFWDRAKRISIMQDPGARAQPLRALLDSTAKHLLMFHYRGDPNGRHNLPGAPMLARLSGVLMVFGLAMCLLRLSDPLAILLVLWLLVPLSGGILSTWFEAPQSLRSIGALPAVYVLVCLPLAWFGSEWMYVFARSDSARPGLRRLDVKRRLVFLSTLVLVLIGLESAFTYFYLWGRDFASWAAFNAAETHLAQDINRYRQDYELRFDPLLTAHLATRYLAPDYTVYHHFDPATVFPLRQTGMQGIVLFVAPDTYPLRRQAQDLYSGVEVETFAHAYSGRVVLHKYVFTPEDIAAAQGLDARYVPLQGDGGQGAAIEQRVDRTIDIDWQDDPPVPYPFEATWTGGLFAPAYGIYTLHVDAPGRFVLELDGRRVLEGEGSASREIVMVQGVHALYLDGQISGPGPVRLMWQTPHETAMRPVPGDVLYRASWPDLSGSSSTVQGVTHGLVGRFYPNADWSGEPERVRLDRQVAYYFHFIPLSRPYTVEWVGRLLAPISGSYRFAVKAVSSASLWIDGQPLIENAAAGPDAEGFIYLASGLHDIGIRYLDNDEHSQVYLYWTVPDAEQELIPADALYAPAEGAWWPVS
jgi:hypothetical protein